MAIMATDRQRAVELCNNWLDNDYLVMDCETTGLGPRDQMIEVAVLGMDEDLRFHEFFKPTVPITPGAISVHRISPQHLEHYHDFKMHFKSFSGVLEAKHLVCYNSMFEERIIRQTCTAFQLHPPIWVQHCMMKLFSMYNGELNEFPDSYLWISLERACSMLKVFRGGLTAHGAIDDCKLIIRLMKAIRDKDLNSMN